MGVDGCPCAVEDDIESELGNGLEVCGAAGLDERSLSLCTSERYNG